jgi:hypothetical protein
MAKSELTKDLDAAKRRIYWWLNNALAPELAEYKRMKYQHEIDRVTEQMADWRAILAAFDARGSLLNECRDAIEQAVSGDDGLDLSDGLPLVHRIGDAIGDREQYESSLIDEDAALSGTEPTKP